MVQSNIIAAYLHGAMHDGTISYMHSTVRIGQNSLIWIESLKNMFLLLGYSAWVYQEGKSRDYYIVESSARFLQQKVSPLSFQDLEERIAYIRGYFDSEGGIPQNICSRLYIQFCQKNYQELFELQLIMSELGIQTGKIHNPSHKIDPYYYRFYVSAKSHKMYIKLINSWHPRKQPLLLNRMKI